MRGDRKTSFYLRGRNYPNHIQNKARSSEMLLTDGVYASYVTFSKPFKFSMSSYYIGRDW